MVRKPREDEEPFDTGEVTGLGGILGGLGGLVKKLAELAETAEEISKSGEFESGGQRGVKGVYGFSVKVGLGGEGVQVQPFGTVRQERPAGQATVVEIREPMVDVFEEADYLLIVAEMPGIGAEDIHLDLQEDILVLSAEKGDKKYRKEVLLPSSFLREKMTISCNNGVVEIKCPR